MKNSNKKLSKVPYLIDLGKHELAERMLKEVLKVDPDNSDAHYYLAFNYFRWGRIKSALKEIDESLRLSPNDSDIHILFAQILADGIDLKRAEEEFKKSIELAPYYVLSYASYAEFLALNKRYREAEKYVKKALKIDPHDEIALNAMGLIGKKVESKKALESIIRQNPIDDSALNNLGVLELESGNYNKAIDCFRNALKTNPENSSARNNIILAIKIRNPVYRPAYKWREFTETHRKKINKTIIALFLSSFGLMGAFLVAIMFGLYKLNWLDFSFIISILITFVSPVVYLVIDALIAYYLVIIDSILMMLIRLKIIKVM